MSGMEHSRSDATQADESGALPEEACCPPGTTWSWGTHEDHQRFLATYGPEEF